jgi:hypothetical protein
MIRVRIEGRSIDLTERELEFQANMSDVAIKQRLAWHFNAPLERFHYYVIDRTTEGSVIVRPEAIFG